MGKPGSLRQASDSCYRRFTCWRASLDPPLPPLCPGYSPTAVGLELQQWCAAHVSHSRVRGKTLAGYVSRIRRLAGLAIQAEIVET